MSGALFIAGGGLRQCKTKAFRAFIDKAGGKKARIAFIVTASGSKPDDLFRSYSKDMKSLGITKDRLVLIPLYAQHVKDEHGYNAMTGDAPELLSYLNDVTGVWFTGGDQYYTYQCMIREDGRDTELLARLREMYNKGLTIGGSSAGAAIMSRVMIGNGNNKGVLSKPVVFGYSTYSEIVEQDDLAEPLVITSGLGFFPEGVVDQHFDCRPRLLRLIKTCLSNPEGDRVGYAVSEDTVLIYYENTIKVLGSANVFIIDCRHAEDLGNGNFRGIVLSSIREGDTLDARSGTIIFKRCADNKQYGYSKDYLSGGIIDSPVFADMIGHRLLAGIDEDLYFSEDRGLPYVIGAVLYDTGDADWLVRLRYYKQSISTGYSDDGGVSFNNILLDIRSDKLI